MMRRRRLDRAAEVVGVGEKVGCPFGEEVELTPCICCGTAKLERWQLVYDNGEAPKKEDYLETICFDCRCVWWDQDDEARVKREEQVLEFKKRFPKSMPRT